MKGRARVIATADGIAVLRSEAPLALRETPSGVFLVGTAAGPIGGDDVTIEIDVAAGAGLTIRSAAAMVALPGTTGVPSRLTIRAIVAGSLRWLPEPSVAAAGCDHVVETMIQIADGGSVEWREELVLGREGERPGKWRASLQADLGGKPLLRHVLAIGSDGWDGPAVIGAARATGSILLAGDNAPASGAVAAEGYAVLPLAASGILITAVASDAVDLRALLDRAKSRVDSRESQALETP